MLVLFLSFFISQPSFALDVQGHRGSRWTHPENTLPAFQFAVESGADTLELDLHVTKDDQLVIVHDHFLDRNICLDKTGRRIRGKILIRALTLKELQAFDCGSLTNSSFPEQHAVPHTPIPTLASLFEMLANSKLPQARKVRFNIETKSEEAHPDYTPDPEIFVKQILALLKKYGVLSRVMLESFDYRTLVIAHRLEPKLQLSVLVGSRMDLHEQVRLMQDLHAEIFSPHYYELTAIDVSEMHAIGVRVIPWTANTTAEWARLIAFGVDGIITDNPKGLLAFIKK